MSTDVPSSGGGVSRFAREHTLGIAGALSAVALGLVFAVVGGLVPASVLPRAPTAVLEAIPTLNALVSLAAIVTISLGARAARAREFEAHKRFMLASTGLFTAFLVMYLYRLTLLGTTDFGGPAAVERFVYLPLLAVHILLAVICVPLVVYVLTLAVTRPIADLFDTAHKRIGRIAASLWLVSFALGVVVYVLLYLVY
jgi:putative membrane protein